MKPADYVRLLLLASIWGGSFVFLRVAAPTLGPAWTAETRVLVGGLVLFGWFRFIGIDVGLRQHARSYLLLGAAIIALPFTLYAYAATHISAPLLSIMNASSPMFGFAWSTAVGDERVSVRKLVGLVLGGVGVALIAGPQEAGTGARFQPALLAALVAACAYGMTGVLMKRFAGAATPRGMAAGSQLAAALVLMPLLPLLPPSATPSMLVLVNVTALAVLASGVAFALYFRLVADVGATRALTVTYLIPIFGALWGRLFLGEGLPPGALAGGISIIAGTVLVTRA